MNAKRILVGILLVLLILSGFVWNEWRLQRAMSQLSATAHPATDETAAKLQQAETRYDEARAQLQIAEQKLAAANSQIAQLDQRLRQLENNPPARVRTFEPTLRNERLVEPTVETPPVKRSWGPEQTVGEPDTLQAGDISTAWAPREPDGGEEWLKVEYERAVDISEVRVRETYNPGAISKVTAFLASGTEMTLWEGIEPKSQAPVEMSFQVPDSVNAKSVKVYLDTKRVPGWNEIDAVELIGRDGSHQWAKQASASSTYAEPRTTVYTRGLERF
jgi:hypothetical protein